MQNENLNNKFTISTNNEKIHKAKISTENGQHSASSLHLVKEKSKDKEKKWERETKIEEEQCYKRDPNSERFYS